VSAPAESFWAALPLGRGVQVLTRDANGLAALSKPAGVLSHPNEPRDQPRALLTGRYDPAEECFVWDESAPSAAPGPGGESRPGAENASGSPRRLWLLNRLDSATSGVILVAADGELAREIRAQFKRKQVRKLYQALVFGVPRQPVEVWQDRLAVSKQGGRIRTAAAAGHIPAESRMRVVTARGAGSGGLALIQLEPRTGRSHQLRVQCAKRHLPIVGDQTYGDFARNREFAKRTGAKRLFLHSLETAFDYEWRGRRHAFAARADLPAEFAAALGAA